MLLCITIPVNNTEIEYFINTEMISNMTFIEKTQQFSIFFLGRSIDEPLFFTGEYANKVREGILRALGTEKATYFGGQFGVTLLVKGSDICVPDVYP